MRKNIFLPGSGTALLQFLMFLLFRLYISVYFSALVFPFQDGALMSSLGLYIYDFPVGPETKSYIIFYFLDFNGMVAMVEICVLFWVEGLHTLADVADLHCLTSRPFVCQSKTALAFI